MRLVVVVAVQHWVVDQLHFLLFPRLVALRVLLLCQLPLSQGWRVWSFYLLHELVHYFLSETVVRAHHDSLVEVLFGIAAAPLVREVVKRVVDRLVDGLVVELCGDINLGFPVGV